MKYLLLILSLGFVQPNPLSDLERVARSIPAIQGNYYEQPKGDTMSPKVEELKQLLFVHLGIEVTMSQPGDNMGGAVGMAFLGMEQFTGRRSIVLAEGQSGNALFETLAHEAGHWLQPRNIRSASSEAEVFAESVGFLVSRAYGHDTLQSSGKYLAQHKSALHVLTDYKQEIQYAAYVLTGGTAHH